MIGALTAEGPASSGLQLLHLDREVSIGYLRVNQHYVAPFAGHQIELLIFVIPRMNSAGMLIGLR